MMIRTLTIISCTNPANTHTHTHTHTQQVWFRLVYSYLVFMARMRLKSLPSSRLFCRCFLTCCRGRGEERRKRRGRVRGRGDEDKEGYEGGV
jgi:hypothetical protein